MKIEIKMKMNEESYIITNYKRFAQIPFIQFLQYQ